MTWIPFTLICGQRGTVVHAVNFFDRPAHSKRRTHDAKCGARVRLLAAYTANAETIALHWPPYVAGAESVGLTRCSACYEATGRPKPFADVGSTEWVREGLRFGWQPAKPGQSDGVVITAGADA